MHYIYIYMPGPRVLVGKTKISFLCNYGVRFMLFCVLRVYLVLWNFHGQSLFRNTLSVRNYGKECNGLYFFHGLVHTQTHIFTDQTGRTYTMLPIVSLQLNNHVYMRKVCTMYILYSRVPCNILSCSREISCLMYVYIIVYIGYTCQFMKYHENV